MAEMFDVAVVGAGPAGYVCAIRCAQLGMKVALVEKRATLGGTCLNVGCIPSKALLESSHYYADIQKGLGDHGIGVAKVSLDVKAMIGRKDKVVKQLTDGIGMLMKKNKISVKNSWGKLAAGGRVLLEGGEEISAKNVVIASGSVPVEVGFAKFDHEVILDSTDALSLGEVPQHLVVVGAGVIGLEMGSVWRRLGAEVTVVDIADRPVAVMDEDLGKEAQKQFEKQGMKFVLGAKVKAVTVRGGKAEVEVEGGDGKVTALKADKVLVAVGRRAATAGMGLEELGVKMDARGVIEIDHHFKTSVDGVYAIGDCVPGPMLAHKGEEEGVALAELLAGQKGHVNYRVIPSVVYTSPELAGVGLTEAEALATHKTVKVGKFKFMANGRALAGGHADGLVKVIAHAQTDELLGVHMIGHNVSEMVGEAVAVMEFKGSAEDLARLVHAHPTMSEAIKEAALACDGRAIHS